MAPCNWPNKNNFVIFRRLPTSPCRSICSKFGIGLLVVDVVIIVNFFGDQLMDIDSVWVANDVMPLTRPVAVNTVDAPRIV